ncbi:hypothetical protein DNTS_005913, partial [Danionella cerebrum]
MILWYQQLEEELNLIAYVNYNSPTVESQFKNGFSVQGNGLSHSGKVNQSPPNLIRQQGEAAEIRCQHSVPSYNQIN